MINDITKKEFLQLLRKAVKFYPSDAGNNKCKRLNSFVLLHRQDQIKKQNFGITAKDELFYFNRHKGVEITYPAMFVWEQTFTIDNRFNTVNQPVKTCHTFEITVLDMFKDDCKNCSDCERRSSYEINCDALEMLSNVFSYLTDSIYAVVTYTDATTAGVWENKNILDELVTAGTITSYVAQNTETRRFLKMLSENNPTINGNNYRNLTNKNLFGAYQLLKVCFKNCAPCDFSFSDIGYSDDSNCCV